MKFIVGLTGGIGSGKSAVSTRFEALGVDIVDADVAARVVVRRGTGALEAIRERFGDQVLTGEGELNRRVLREIVFSRERERAWLETLLHPLIASEVREALTRATSAYAMLVSPLLKETGQVNLVNRVLVVHACEALRIDRTLARDGGDEAGVRAIIGAQMASEERLAMADDVIVNESDLAHLDEQVGRLDRLYRRLAEVVH